MTEKRTLRPTITGFVLAVSILALAVPVAGQEVHPRAGTTSVPLLNLGFGAIGTALAEGLTASTVAPGAIWWNPAAAAGLAGGEGGFLALGGARLTAAASSTSIAWGTRTAGMGVAFLASYSGLTGIEVRGDLPTEEPLSTTSAYDLVTGMSLGIPIRNARLGFSVKGVYEKLDYADAWGIALDAGIQVPLPGDLLQVGASVRNLGRMGVLDRERLELPWSMAVGAALAEPVGAGGWRIHAAADLWKPADDWTQLRVGVEAARDLFRLRAGTRQGRGWKTISMGIGVILGEWQFDYAYVYDPDPDRRFAGSLQRVGIRVHLEGRNDSGH